ncbi:phage tail tube protein [Yoonia sp. 208BN28-4]|uniref:phage tail tube protein n=1 Tax=Yoonia sp. 208BN28-4 TaxID=3126505 RepID=UPI0030B28F4F
MSNAISGFGIEYKIDTSASPGTHVAVAELADLGDPPGDTVDDIEVTHHKSPGRRKEFIAGLTDGGEAVFMINWVPGDGTDVKLQDLRATSEVRSHQIVWPNNYAWTFSGYIKSLKPAAPINDRMTLAVTVKVTGSTAMAAGA